MKKGSHRSKPYFAVPEMLRQERGEQRLPDHLAALTNKIFAFQSKFKRKTGDWHVFAQVLN